MPFLCMFSKEPLPIFQRKILSIVFFWISTYLSKHTWIGIFGILMDSYKAQIWIGSVQLLSHVQPFVTPWITARQGSPVHHQLLEFTQTHVHRVGDAIQPSHPLLSPSPPAPNPSQHQGLFQWVSSSREVAKVLEFQLQHQSFHWTHRTDLLQNGLVGSPCSPRDSQESSPTPRFKNINSSALSFLHSPTLTFIHDHWKKHSLDLMDFFGRIMSLLFNMLSRLVIAFLPRSKCLLISWLQSPFAVILEPRKIKSASVSPSISP